MTRKRFIKMAMSYGLQRNEAEGWTCYVDNFGSYRSLFTMLLGNRMAKQLAQMVKQLTRQLHDHG